MSGCVNRLLTASHLNFSKLYVSRVEVHWNGNLHRGFRFQNSQLLAISRLPLFCNGRQRNVKNFKTLALRYRSAQYIFCFATSSLPSCHRHLKVPSNTERRPGWIPFFLLFMTHLRLTWKREDSAFWCYLKHVKSFVNAGYIITHAL